MINEDASLTLIRLLLSEQKYESARRVCLARLAVLHENESDIRLLLHFAYRQLGDISIACQTLQQMPISSAEDHLQVLLLLAEDHHLLSHYDFYRHSPEARAGLTGEEYEVLQQQKATAYFAQASALATTDAQRQQVAVMLRQCQRVAEADDLVPPGRTEVAPLSTLLPTGVLSGTISYADGIPVIGRTVTLGLHVEVEEADAAVYDSMDMGYEPRIGEQRALTTTTDERGYFSFHDVPATSHEFLAVSLDPERFAINTRFLAQGIEVIAGQEKSLALTVDEWRSTPSREIANPFPARIMRHGIAYRQVQHEVLCNPFYDHFARQPVSFSLPSDISANPLSLLLLSSSDPDAAQPFQLTGNTLTFFTDLPQKSECIVALFVAENGMAEQAGMPTLSPMPEADGQTAIIDSGRAAFRIPWEVSSSPLPPLVAIRVAQGAWRGRGRMVLPDGISIISQHSEVLERGPLLLVVRISYTLSNNSAYIIELTAHRDEPYLLAREICADVPGMAFDFSLAEFSGGRGFLHWKPESGDLHWSDLTAEDRELARLQESVAWWIPPQGFGYAMTSGSMLNDDYIGVFTIRRGEWVDRKFARITNGPVDNYELDWPYPEMVGSTISMITAHTSASGDAYFRFKAFDGERRWGILASTLARNDGPGKEISTVQHKNSSPRLQDFKGWRLDEQDGQLRPSVVVEREKLLAVRKKVHDPLFANYWQQIVTGKAPGPSAGVRFAVEGDPLVAWRLKRNLISVAQIRAKMTLLGRDFGDMYSPVGARPITPLAEEYDLIAASGVFTPDEERLVRAFFILMGHMYMETDLMNWKFNGRNTNFEADRMDVVGAVGLAFATNPDGKAFIAHASECLERTIGVYTTPGSGKWYENPACYYFTSLRCRMNLAFHLATQLRYDPTQIPRMKEFLHWGILLATPRFPIAYDLLRDGATDRAYRQSTLARRVPPIGDHAGLGTWYPELYPLMAKCYRPSNPEFADFLLWAYQAGGSDGGYFSQMPLLFCQLDVEDLAPASPHTLVSRKLEGFGAVMRGHFDQSNEFYLLFKLGPGGYRYHRSEGSIILFADGKPLIYDGGEGGEAWRHSTLSFYETHMPLAPGHIERFQSFPGIDFAQGVNPKALQPGEPNFLSDLCEDSLVEVAYQRFNEPHPADARSIIWVKDEYIVMHDELNLPLDTPAHWHLQVVADGETGNANDGYRFSGRYGADLQVLLPEQYFSGEKLASVPLLEYRMPVEKIFRLRHLMLSSSQPDHYLAVLRPLPAGKRELTAKEVRANGQVLGVSVRGDDIDDVIFFARQGMNVTVGEIHFSGKYAAVVHRGNRTEFTVLDGTTLRTPEITIESTGPAVFVSLAANSDDMQVVRNGEGSATLTYKGQSVVVA